MTRRVWGIIGVAATTGIVLAIIGWRAPADLLMIAPLVVLIVTITLAIIMLGRLTWHASAPDPVTARDRTFLLGASRSDPTLAALERAQARGELADADLDSYRAMGRQSALRSLDGAPGGDRGGSAPHDETPPPPSSAVPPRRRSFDV